MELRRPRLPDVALAVVGAAVLVADGVNRRHGASLPAADYVLALVACAPLAWRSVAPLTVLLAMFAGLIACLAAFEPYDTAIVLVMIPLYTVAVVGGRRRSIAVGVGTAVVLVAIIAAIEHDEGGMVQQAGLRLLLAIGALVVGDTVRSRRALVAANLERLARAAHEREEDSRRRVVGERLRIARELHDTLAHALVAINVRAGVAAHLADAGDQPAALAEIKDLSAEALRDLRCTLSLLRQEGDVAPTGPAFDLSEVPGLVERARATGVDAVADVRVIGKAIPSPVGQAGFRIVQESLTNVLRHADASTARVRVSVISNMLDIEVIDDGRGGTLHAVDGHGVRGMVERAGALGGNVAAGPAAGGGWRVHAQLPLARADR
ncbi:MAG TPA: histidine kinase [Baekduia sp.]|uniref:sensor histidine kinase n=1 Tax=Baekduia sp. TaxID=2600305 RepID=UPI002B6AACD4|nr:histidine kinase [Baekduia sp.]HMJ33383.1 histidine kinase [Baekduia sp.]